MQPTLWLTAGLVLLFIAGLTGILWSNKSDTVNSIGTAEPEPPTMSSVNEALARERAAQEAATNMDAIPQISMEHLEYMLQLADAHFDEWMDRKVERLEAKGCVDADWFNARIAGVSHRNDDGSSRQALLEDLDKALDSDDHPELRLVPEPRNRYDPNAIGLHLPGKRQLGYLEARIAADVTRGRKRGIRYRVFVRRVDGGGEGKHFGCGIAILRWTPVD